MKIDFNYKFVDLEKENIPTGPPEFEEKDGKKVPKKIPPFRLRKLCANVLLGQRIIPFKCPKCGTQTDKAEDLSGEEKTRRYVLAIKIYDSTDLVDIGTKDIELLKKLISHAQTSIIVGQAWGILDPHGQPEK